MHITQILILAIIQGLAELLPVSSSAHVIVGEKLMGIDPSSPQATIMLAMLHTGTMFAVIVYFWKGWKRAFFSSSEAFSRFATRVIVATAITGIVGFGLIKGIEKALEPKFSTIKSESLVETGSAQAPGTASLLTHLASIRSPQKPLFAAGDRLTLKATKGGKAVAERVLVVAEGMTAGDLLKFYRDALEIPNVALEAHPTLKQAVKVTIVSPIGHENRLAADKSGLVDANKQARLSFADFGKGEVEHLFKKLNLLAAALAAAGALILISGLYSATKSHGRTEISAGDSVAIGAVQGLCLPFRGFSRSGATISVGLLGGVSRQLLEEFSFALAVVLTPPVVLYEAYRLYKAGKTSDVVITIHDFTPSLIGMVFSFLAGLFALKILSRLLEKGQWWIFGVYCLAGSAGIYWMYTQGY